jgi:predicted nuclease of predicted toxin-antitoxin system
MRLLVDMNLSPNWIPMLEARGWEARHWSEIGPGDAPDSSLMKWAREEGHVILTQDLDFSQLLFSSGDRGPSVVLLRMMDEFDPATRDQVFRALEQARPTLMSGALMIVSGNRARIRRLPIVSPGD